MADIHVESPFKLLCVHCKYETSLRWNESHLCISLMFIPCIIRRSRNKLHNALFCTTPLFYAPAPTCLGSCLPLSGSFLDPSELLEIQIEWVVYHIMCGYVACVLECRGSDGTHYHILCDITTHSICISSNSCGSKKLPDDGRLLPKYVGASIYNKGVVRIIA
jgi:hypothetical protein